MRIEVFSFQGSKCISKVYYIRSYVLNLLLLLEVFQVLPLFFHFSGGKVATALGTTCCRLVSDMGAMMLTTWVVLLLSGYSSLAAARRLLAPLYTYWLKPGHTMPVAMLCALVVYRHTNIIRLLNGQEDKIWQRNKRRP